MTRTRNLLIAAAFAAGMFSAFCTPAGASTILGGLVGGDLTDPENDGQADADVNYNATFFASDEPNFGGGEGAFNVFDNLVGGGNAKWCCGGPVGFPEIVGARNFTAIAGPIELTRFTLTSSNDSPQRDPVVWEVQGSNDTTDGLDGTWTTIYDHPAGIGSDWTARNQTISYSPGEGDVFLTSDGFSAFRVVTNQTGATSGAFFALNEVEFFGQEAGEIPEPLTCLALAIGSLGLGFYTKRRRTA